MVPFRQILQMHANWVGSLIHSGLDAETRKTLQSEVVRIDQLHSRFERSTGGIELSGTWTTEDLTLALRACETAIVQLEILLAIGGCQDSIDAGTSACDADLSDALATTQGQRDAITARLCAARLFTRLIDRTVSTDSI